jgi:hypothetical protein
VCRARTLLGDVEHAIVGLDIGDDDVFKPTGAVGNRDHYPPPVCRNARVKSAHQPLQLSMLKASSVAPPMDVAKAIAAKVVLFRMFGHASFYRAQIRFELAEKVTIPVAVWVIKRAFSSKVVKTRG